MKKNKKQNKSHRIFLNTPASIHSDSFTRHFLAIAMSDCDAVIDAETKIYSAIV